MAFRKRGVLASFGRQGRRALGLLAGVAGVALVGALDLLPTETPTLVPALLFLIPVVLATTIGGGLAGVLTAAIAAPALLYLFVPPFHSWSLGGELATAGGGHASKVLVLGAFVAAALVAIRFIAAGRSEAFSALSARDRLEFLSRATDVLHRTLDPRDTLRELAQLCVPRLADWCSVEVVGADGGLELEAVAHVDPQKVALAQELRRRYPPDPGSLRGAPNVVRTLEPELYRKVSLRQLRAAARDEEQLRLARDLKLRSAVVVPLVARNTALGAITLVFSESSRRYDEEDLAFVQDLAQRAALAMDNARLYQERTRVAITLQRSLLPEDLPEVPGLEIAGRYRAGGDEAEVGGDFYDVFPAGDRAWAVVIGDVCGRGVEAAALTAMARHTIRTATAVGQEPADALRVLNDAMLQAGEGSQYCTVAHGRIVPAEGHARLQMVSGGHPLPLIVRTAGEVEAVGEPGSLIGILPELHVSPAVTDLGPGDVLVLYTDGVTEAGAPAAPLEEEGLRTVLRSALGLSAERIADAIVEAAVEAAPEGRRDDLAVLVVRVPPAEHLGPSEG